jgi:tryptophan synthase alpha chain
VSRLDARLAALRQDGRKALVPFITAGDPDTATTVLALHALVRGGADVLEIGVPFSDPEADGPVIQAASERALAAGFRLHHLFDLIGDFRRDDADTPIVLMGYLNCIERFGYANFADAAHRAGVDGLIVVNLPPEEAQALKQSLSAVDIDLIFLIAPTTTESRSHYILSQAQGFVYFVSLKGVTGSSNLDADRVASRVSALRALTSLPLLIGFGIKDGASARRVADVSDGVIVGAALVGTMASLGDQPADIPAALEAQLHEIRNALDR